MKEVLKRTITGTVLVAVIVSTTLGGAYPFFAFCLITSLIGLMEFYRLFEADLTPLNVGAGVILSTTLLITAFLFIQQLTDERVMLLNLPLVSIVFLTVLFARSGNPFSDLALTFLGVVYIPFSFLLLFATPFAQTGIFDAQIVLGYFMLLWANDTGAYLSGSLIGKNKLAPRISPKKTWEGSAGGALLVVAMVYVNDYFFHSVGGWDWLVMGMIVMIMGTLGDLVKSVMKRSRNAKDSGTILPGHGGILDRFDSMIGSVPFIYAYLSTFC